MPELPEVELMCRRLAQWTKGKNIVRIEGVDNADVLLHKNIRKCFRRGKYCILLIGEMCAVIHFRMTGKVVLLDRERRFLRRKLILDDGTQIGIIDQRRFSTFEIFCGDEYAEKFSSLGDEVWPIHRNGDWYRDRFGERKGIIKPLLLRQDIVSGLGNIMCSEILFRTRCHPQMIANQISTNIWDSFDAAIHDYIDSVLTEEGSSEIQYVSQGGAVPKSFLVYGRHGEPCPKCMNPISHWKMGGRATFACSICQKKD